MEASFVEFGERLYEVSVKDFAVVSARGFSGGF